MTLTYPHNDNIKAMLQGKADFVQQQGLNYLIPAWQKFANHLEAEDSIYEWLNDLDTRKIIDEILEVLPDNERNKIEQDLTPIDAKVIEGTVEVNECVWGDIVEHEHQYNRQKHWYYYRVNQRVFDHEARRFTKRD